MKENINNLTAALIIICITVLSYNYASNKTVEITKDTSEQTVIKDVTTINQVKISDLVEEREITKISQVVITGDIKWPRNREARFFTRDTSITTYVDWIGKFNLTIPLDSSCYITFDHGMERTAMYCNPDDTVHITINTKEFDETITYTGSKESNFLAWKYLHVENIGYPNVKTILDTTELNQKLDSLINPLELKMVSLDLNNNFISSEKKEHEQMRNYFLSQYTKNQKMLEMIGKSAIDFTYPDMDSNMISLSDFKGSYVYVDIWATWCGPCKYEIPFLVQLEKDYHDENIIFMSVSVDVENAKQKWIDMINEEDMGGVQLISTDGWKSQIMKDYAINGIPRFMLFDREANVISVDAPRPSSEEIRDIFDGFKNIENQTEEVENSEEETVNL